MLCQPFEYLHLGIDGDIADSDGGHVRGVLRERLRHQPGGVGEVNQQRAGRKLAHGVGDIQDDGDGAQRLRHAAHAGGFLADQAVPLAQVLILPPGFHAADPQLSGDVARAAHRFAQIRRQAHFEGRAGGLDHALSKPADDVQPLRRDVHQP